MNKKALSLSNIQKRLMLRSLTVPSRLLVPGLVFKGNRVFPSRDSRLYHRPTWGDQELKILLNCYEDRLKDSSDNRTDSQLWQDISQSLQEGGFTRLASQCSSKWRRLRSTYEKAKESGDEESLPFHDKLSKIFSLQESTGRSKSYTRKVLPDSPDTNESNDDDSSEDVSNIEEVSNNKRQTIDPKDSFPLHKPTSKNDERTFISTDSHEGGDLSHKLIELLRSQLEFQNLIYRDIVEELQKSRHEEYLLRKEFLAVLKESGSIKMENPTLANDNETHSENIDSVNSDEVLIEDHPYRPSLSESSPNLPFDMVDHSSNDGIDIFEADENLRALRDNLSCADIPQKPSH
ncbi:hypothetical protein K7432_005570 [Basidiobolus ranarum]|uniref:Myb-like domain-containing protein n=1 Tax=Basidiobolus ranarum TaxID=34480 RepID=A0ABR2W325_9FUNG